MRTFSIDLGLPLGGSISDLAMANKMGLLYLSGIPDKSLWGTILLYPLKLLPAGMQMPILQGKLKSKKWIVGSSNHSCWLGSDEYDKQVLFEKPSSKEKCLYICTREDGVSTLTNSSGIGKALTFA